MKRHTGKRLEFGKTPKLRIEELLDVIDDIEALVIITIDKDDLLDCGWSEQFTSTTALLLAHATAEINAAISTSRENE